MVKSCNVPIFINPDIPFSIMWFRIYTETIESSWHWLRNKTSTYSANGPANTKFKLHFPTYIYIYVIPTNLRVGHWLSESINYLHGCQCQQGLLCLLGISIARSKSSWSIGQRQRGRKDTMHEVTFGKWQKSHTSREPKVPPPKAGPPTRNKGLIRP